MVKLVRGGSVINGAYPVQFLMVTPFTLFSLLLAFPLTAYHLLQFLLKAGFPFTNCPMAYTGFPLKFFNFRVLSLYCVLLALFSPCFHLNSFPPQLVLPFTCFCLLVVVSATCFPPKRALSQQGPHRPTPPPPKVYKSPIRGDPYLEQSRVDFRTLLRGGAPPPSKSVQKSTLLKLKLRGDPQSSGLSSLKGDTKPGGGGQFRGPYTFLGQKW